MEFDLLDDALNMLELAVIALFLTNSHNLIVILFVGYIGGACF